MLVLAATPIGNLEDASSRLAKLLATADAVYAEDTRQSGKLLRHLGVERKLFSFHDHSDDRTLKTIGAKLREGQTIAYISDAGMPGVNDPGYELVRLAIELDVEIDVLPGPSAVLNALVLSGCAADRFCFLGFFPVKAAKRRDAVDELAKLGMTAIYFEAPSRVEGSLAFLAETLPNTTMALCRELTKLHQEVLRGCPTDILDALKVVKGEMVLVIDPVERAEEPKSIPERHAELLAAGNSPSKCIRLLAQEFRLSKREITAHINEST